jgi:hypothetical protein
LIVSANKDACSSRAAPQIARRLLPASLACEREHTRSGETKMKFGRTAVLCLLICGAIAFAAALTTGTARAQQAPAAANNERLLKVFPKGFALDAAHRPHITLIQRFVRTADLDKVYSAAHRVFAAANVKAMKLEAFKYYYAPGGAIGVAGICAKPTPEILKLQADIIAAVAPFTVETGPIGAFTAPHSDAAMDAALIQYVSTFVPKQTGDNFNPHVSTGVAPKEYLDKMLTDPFEPFTFSPGEAAVYQLGPYGTAAKKLKEWNFKP